MPIEILELIVRANIDEQPAIVQPGGNNAKKDNDIQKTVIIEECVEQVLEILHHRDER